jgi:tryptophan synthase alpha chain
MNTLTKLLKNKNKNILSVYFTTGYPNLNDTEININALENAGVDLLELGLPNSDPLADGPIIQGSSQVALQNGMNADVLFNQLKAMPKKPTIPLVIMAYYNNFLQYGEEKFIKECKSVGVAGIILPDLPSDIFLKKYKTLFIENNIHFIFMITPHCSDERIRMLDEISSGFIYAVAQNATTGKESQFNDNTIRYFERIKNMNLINPILVGFGIDSALKFKTVCNYVSGGIIGSAYIKFIHGKNIEDSSKNFINQIKSEHVTAN